MADTYDLYAEELPSIAPRLEFVVGVVGVMAATSTLGTAGTLSSVASSPTASTGFCAGTASTWAPGLTAPGSTTNTPSGKGREVGQ